MIVGQDLQFSKTGADVFASWPTVYRFVSGELESVYTPDADWRFFNVNWPTSGAYYVSDDAGTPKQCQLSVVAPSMPLSLKVGFKGVSSIAKGTPLIVDTSGMNLFENDTVKLVITDPHGSVIKVKDGQVFDPITVKNLTAWYGVGSAGIDTTNFTVCR